ncbi:hypothetical protein PAXRUDRAFT_763851 [Paxillus rubicundulus Ve08.2h10]|uniref:Alcohol O-acetyltransferase n=1 Tax=Paxillus rubicundulus Ve08.2h10 TaxID=930991 RepID=A0A0D0DHA7_9AGAM|nr:hypothetical protein PAXRUDRAFT_763851 [Paxillus rubicundulus Ve08.2h10]
MSSYPPPSPPLSDASRGESLVASDVQTVAQELRQPCAQRKLGSNELSYFLPSRANGVNDMYLHLGFDAPEQLVHRARVHTVWAILRVRHPLLASKVVIRNYDDVRFIYTPPQSPEDALLNTENTVEYRNASKDDLIGAYLNGARTLSNDRLSYLIVSQGGPPSLPTSASCQTTPTAEGTLEPIYTHDILICAAHFLGDGMALHQFANDLFGLLGSQKTQQELDKQLSDEWVNYCSPASDKIYVLPNAMEENFPAETSKFRRAIGKVDFNISKCKTIGGQTFPQKSRQARHTIVPTVSYDEDRTKAILKRCKTHGVSISAALFAICNIAWARYGNGQRDLPTLMYSALNVRPYFTVKSPHDSYWFLALGYFNVVLPNFIPQSVELSSIFWHRARLAKEQSNHAAKHPMVVSRCQLMAAERAQRARVWAKEDDDKEHGIPIAPPLVPQPAVLAPRTPSSALIGLSLLGNLDGMYKHASFPAIQLHTLTTGSRQRPGGMLLFGYTFARKLWISLGYDENGFEKEVVERFWEGVLQVTDEVLIR